MNKKKLLDAINSIKPGISSNSIIEQSNLVIFDKKRLVSYNDEIAISVPFESDLSGGIPADELFKLLQRMSGEEIKVNQEENQIVFSCGKAKAGFNVQETTIPDLIINNEDKAWKPLPKDFSTALSFCLFSAATDISKGILTCLKAEKNTIVSCDNFRLTHYQMVTRLIKPLLVPGNIVKALISHIPVKYIHDDNWIHFQNKDGVIFSCRTMDGDYPDISKLFDVEGETVKLPKELKEVLSRAEVLAADNQNAGRTVALTLEKGIILCRAENIVGWITEEIKANYKGEKISFSIDPNLLSQILDRTDIAVIGEDKIRFDGDNFVHVIALTVRK